MQSPRDSAGERYRIPDEEYVTSVSYRKEARKQLRKRHSRLCLSMMTSHRRSSNRVMNISARVPEYIQVGCFEFVVEMKNLDLDVPRDFVVSVKDAPGFVMAGESKTTKTANRASCFLRLKIVAASGERFLPSVLVACPKLAATWTNTQHQSVLVLPVAL